MSLATLGLFPMISSGLREMSVQTVWGLGTGISVSASMEDITMHRASLAGAV